MTTRRICLAAILATACASPGGSGESSGDAEGGGSGGPYPACDGCEPGPGWSMYQGGPQHTGRVATAGPSGTLEPAWPELTLPHEDRSFNWMAAQPLVVGPDGSVYLARAWIEEDAPAELVAIGPNGAVDWTFGEATGWTTPAVTADGTVYVGTSDGTIHALSPTGEVVWTFDGSEVGVDYLSGHLTIAPNGTVLASFVAGVLALSPEGDLRWIHPPTGAPPQDWPSIPDAPAVASDGNIYVAADDALYALSDHGELLWRYPRAADVSAEPATVGDDGNIYYALRDPDGNSWLIALDKGGNLLWEYGAELFFGDIDVVGAPALGPDGTVVYVATNLELHAVDAATGEAIWNEPQGIAPGGTLNAFPIAVDATNAIYWFGEGQLTRMSPDMVQFTTWGDVSEGAHGGGPCFGDDGTLFQVAPMIDEAGGQVGHFVGAYTP